MSCCYGCNIMQVACISKAHRENWETGWSAYRASECIDIHTILPLSWVLSRLHSPISSLCCVFQWTCRTSTCVSRTRVRWPGTSRWSRAVLCLAPSWRYTTSATPCHPLTRLTWSGQWQRVQHVKPAVSSPPTHPHPFVLPSVRHVSPCEARQLSF